MRLLAVLLCLFAAPVLAQDGPDAVRIGTRVRVFIGSDVLPPDGVQFVGSLQAVGDTLVIATDGGSLVRVLPRELAGFDVSGGRRPFPYWVVATGAAAGFGGGYALGKSVSEEEFCTSFGLCARRRNDLKFYVPIIVGTAFGAVVTSFVGGRLSAEQWVPAGRLSVEGAGVRWAVRL